ncbi:MAG: tripartite tricarboxylate transporter TctB family protein [Rhodospirillales bacterium]
MKLTKDHFGANLFPLLGSGYAAFSLWEHFSKDYREMTVNYALFINVPLLILAAVCIGRFLFVEGALEERTSLEYTPPTTGEKHVIRPIGLIVLSTLLVVSIQWAGYLLCFFIFTVLAQYLMGLRRHRAILTVSVVTTAAVHFIFVELLQLQLPPGPFAALLG